MTKPVLYYDGDCGFCRGWIVRWAAWTGGAVEYQSGQKAGDACGISKADLARAVVLQDVDGKTYTGAEAVFRSLAMAPGALAIGLTLYRRFSFFRRGSEAGYACIAARRPLFSRWTRRLWGEHLEPSSYRVSRWLFLRLLALCYLTAFLSLISQLDGLIGERGITPALAFLERVSAQLPGAVKYWQVPTLLWLSPQVPTLYWLCAGGTLLSLLLLIGFAQIPVLLLLWAFYLSLASVASPWLGYQWDNMLLEVGLLAVFAAPSGIFKRSGQESSPSRLGVFLLQAFLFKLMFSSGMVKLLSNDAVWWDMTALSVHYETQCLPTPLGWYAHQLPLFVQKVSAAVMFVIELALPFLFFAPRRLRFFAGLGTALLMALIALTGNYTFFNWLTLACVLMLFDDAFWRGCLPVRGVKFIGAGTRLEGRSTPLTGVRTCAGVYLLAAMLGVQLATLGWGGNILAPLSNALLPLRTLNAYGLFAAMTTRRHEIVLEGSAGDGEWKAYEFKYKPGDVRRAPAFVAPHQPRLDWQMWFAVLAPYNHPRNGWFYEFAARLLEGSPAVGGLLAVNPFADQPPKALRAMLYRYRFTTWAERRADGAWWKREKLGLFCPPLALKP